MSPATPPAASLAPLALAEHPSLRRRFFLLLPAVFISYSLAYLDRSNFGFGAAAGMAQTLHITGADLSLLTAAFFVGYFLFQVPGARLAKRVGAHRLVFVSLLAWGILASLTGVIRTLWMLVIDRFLIGVAECIVFPVIVALLTRWFTRGERSRANSFLILGNPVTVLWMSAITGYLIDAIGWQKAFILEGLPSVVWAFVWLTLVKDRPSEATWLTPEAARALDAELAAEQRGMAAVGSVREAFLRPDVLLLVVQYFCWSLGVYGFVLWLPTIVRQGASLNMGRTGLLSAVPYALAVVMMLTVSWLSDRSMIREGLVWPFLLVGGLAMLGSFFSAGHSFPVAFAFLVLAGGCMYAPYGPFFAIIPERLPGTVTGEVVALINASGALGGFVGTYFVGWLQSATGGPRAGFLLMALFVIASAGLMAALRWIPRDRMATA